MPQLLIDYRPELHRPPRTNLYDAGGITFMPGINQVDQGMWDAIKSNPLVKMRVSEGILRVMDATQTESQDSSIVDYSKVIDAISLIEKTFDLRLLQKWQSEDSRKAVQQAIAEQIAKIREDKVEQLQTFKSAINQDVPQTNHFSTTGSNASANDAIVNPNIAPPTVEPQAAKQQRKAPASNPSTPSA